MKRVKRNGLRPITAITPQGEPVKGFLVGTSPEGDLEGGVGYFAAVEKLDGTVIMCDIYKIKFDDVEE